MHILHVIDSLGIGGAERMLVDLSNATRCDGHQVSVCITREGRQLVGELRPDIPLWVLSRSWRFDLGALRRFTALVRQHEVSLLHAHGRSTFSFLAFAASTGYLHRPLLLHDHYGGVETDPSIPCWFRWWANRFVAHYVGVYEKLGLWAREAGIPASQVSVIGNALDLDRVAAHEAIDVCREFGIESGTTVGIVIAGIRPEKGIHILIEAVNRSRHRRNIVILVVGGSRNVDYMNRCMQAVSTFGLEASIRFVGERLDALSLAQGADFAVIPSVSESGPLVLIEYLACGLPVVASRVGDIARRAESCGLDEFVTACDPSVLAAAIDRFLTLTPGERYERGRRGMEMAERLFHIRSVMPAWYQVYGQMMKDDY